MEVRLLGKMKLYELAKEMNVSSKDLLEIAKSLGMKIKSHLSNIEDEDIEKLKKHLSNGIEKEIIKREDKKVKKETQVKNDNPVIIRRDN